MRNCVQLKKKVSLSGYMLKQNHCNYCNYLKYTDVLAGELVGVDAGGGGGVG